MPKIAKLVVLGLMLAQQPADLEQEFDRVPFVGRNHVFVEIKDSKRRQLILHHLLIVKVYLWSYFLQVLIAKVTLEPVTFDRGKEVFVHNLVEA